MFNLKENDNNFVMISWYVDELKDKLIIDSVNEGHYTKEDKENMIKNIIDSHPIPDITIAKENDKFRLIDGVKRLSAINDFVDGKINYKGQNYNDLNEDLKKLFLGYQLCIRLI